MNRHLRIAVADDELDMRDYFQTILPCFGHTVVAAASTGRELVERCRETRPDLVITDIKMPDMDGIDAARQIYQDFPIPVILVSGFHDQEIVERAEEDHVLAFLVKPIKQADLEPAIAIATRRFAQFQALRQEAVDLRQAIEDRKLIERAKGLLMKRAGLDEHEAFRRLQRLASERNRKLVEIATMILTAEEAFQPVDKPKEKDRPDGRTRSGWRSPGGCRRSILSRHAGSDDPRPARQSATGGSPSCRPAGCCRAGRKASWRR